MRALLVALLAAAPAASWAAGALEIRVASRETVAAMQAIVAAPDAGGLAGAAPELGALRSWDPSDPGVRDAAGLIAAFLPVDFAARASRAAAAGPEGAAERAAVAAELTSAHATASLLAAEIVDGRVRRLTRQAEAGRLSGSELAEKLRGLEAFAIFGEAAAGRVARARQRQSSSRRLRLVGEAGGEPAPRLAAAAPEQDAPALAPANADEAGVESARGAVAAASVVSLATRRAAALDRAQPHAAQAAAFSPNELAAGRYVELELAQGVSSHTHGRGDRVAFTVMADVRAGGRLVLAKGAPAFGRVVASRVRGFFGRSGTVAVRADYALTPEGAHVSLTDAELREWTPAAGWKTAALLGGLPVLGLFLAWLFAPPAELLEGAPLTGQVDPRG